MYLDVCDEKYPDSETIMMMEKLNGCSFRFKRDVHVYLISDSDVHQSAHRGQDSLMDLPSVF